MRIPRSVIICLFLTASVSCRKSVKMFDLTCPGFNPVHPQTWGPSGFEKSAPVLYGAPRFNPNNPNEIIFVLEDNQKEAQYLVKYDLASKTMVKLLKENVYGKLQWAMDGWIYYGRAHTWKLKSDGDSLGVLTAGKDSLAPSITVSRQGNRFAYTTNTSTVIFDKNLLTTDTLPFYINNASWSYDGSKITTWGYQPGGTSERFGFYDLLTKQFHQLPDMGANTNYSDWFPNSNHIVWTSGEAMFKTDTLGNTVKLTKDCINKTYLWPSVSPDGRKIIYQRTYLRLIAEDTAYTEVDLYMMNADGSDDHKIEINYK